MREPLIQADATGCHLHRTVVGTGIVPEVLSSSISASQQLQDWGWGWLEVRKLHLALLATCAEAGSGKGRACKSLGQPVEGSAVRAKVHHATKIQALWF